MKQNKLFLMLLLIPFFIGCSKKYSSIEKPFQLAETVKEIDSTNTLSFTYHKDSKIRITFFKDTIKIFESKNIIKIPYSVPFENVFPCEGLVVNNEPTNRSYFLYDKDILLLPLNDINNRVSLIVCNLKNGNVFSIGNTVNYILSTNSPWFLFNENKGIILTSNMINTDEETMIHFFSIKDKILIKTKDKSLQFKEEYITDEKELRNFLIDQNKN